MIGMKKHNDDTMRQIAESYLNYLRDVPDGTETSSAKILLDHGHDLNNFETNDLMDFHEALFEVANKHGIILDNSAFEGMLIGMPFNIPFIIHNEDAQIRCPKCGSKNCAYILYGEPAYTPELKKELAAKRVILGGCIISENDPEFICNECGTEFNV